MRRRDIVRALGLCIGLRAFDAVARKPGTPLVGFLSARSVATDRHLLDAFRCGMKSSGFVEGDNVEIDFRWADGRYDDLPTLAAQLRDQGPAVIVAMGGNASTVAAREATETIPIVFGIGGDPVELGLVNSFSRPTANLTGMTMLWVELDAKRLELLHELAPHARTIVALANPSNPIVSLQLRVAEGAAAQLGLELRILSATTATRSRPRSGPSGR